MIASHEEKIKSLEQLKNLSDTLKRVGTKIVHCHGVFDLLHLGHIRYLNSAKKHGDVLVVTLTADKFVKRGPGRPVFNHTLRAETIANLAIADYVAIVDHPTAIEAIEAIRPDFYVKGPDYKNSDDDLTGKIVEEQEKVEALGGQIVFTDDITFSSSKLINSHLDTYPPDTVKYLKEFAKKYPAEEIVSQLQKIKEMKVLVIGDAIIDQYHYCTPMGKSAKESIVANRYTGEEDFAGGALATANHTAQLSHNVELLTVLGKQKSYEEYIRTRLDPHISPTFIHRNNCVTTIKRRYIGQEGNRKLFEVCFMDDTPVPAIQENEMLTFLEEHLPLYDLVIASDFGHGMITPAIIERLCASSRQLAVNVQTNSANVGFNVVTKYPRADFVCIDEREIRLAAQDRHSELFPLMEEICEKMHCSQMITTRGQYGALSYSRSSGFSTSPALASHGVDTVGAGDAFFAYAAPCFAAGMPSELLAFIGNAVGALKLQILCNREAVKLVDVMKFINRLLKV